MKKKAPIVFSHFWNHYNFGGDCGILKVVQSNGIADVETEENICPI